MEARSITYLILNGVQKCEKNMHTSLKGNVSLGGATSKLNRKKNPNRRWLNCNFQ